MLSCFSTHLADKIQFKFVSNSLFGLELPVLPMPKLVLEQVCMLILTTLAWSYKKCLMSVILKGKNYLFSRNDKISI